MNLSGTPTIAMSLFPDESESLLALAGSLRDSLGLGVPVFLALLACYVVYRKAIRPFDFTQDLDLPSQTEKRRDIVNLTRRLRKMGHKIPPPYPNGWYCLMESQHLKAGEIKPVDCLGEHFAVFRTTDGVAHVSNAYCPHLGANIAIGGTVGKNCVECPFHKWRFDANDGKCVAVPNTDSVPKGPEIKIWESCEVNEGIFIWFDAEGRPPQWKLPSVEQIDSGEWIYHGRNEFLVASHIQDIPENGADVAHLNAIHQDNLLSGTVLPTPHSWNIFGEHEWNGKWEPSEMAHEARVGLTHKISIVNKMVSLEFDVTARQLGPSYVHLQLWHRFGTVIFLQTIVPLEPLLQKVIHRLYAPWYLRPIANFIMWGETVMFHRDVMVWNSKEFVNSPMLAKTDRCIKAFRSWFRQFYTENSTTFKEAILGPQRDLVDW